MKRTKNNYNDNELDFKRSKYNPYPKLASERVIFFNEAFTPKVAAELGALLLYYDHIDSKKDIVIYINSPGGSCAGLIQIYDIMKMVVAPISTICLSQASSAAAVILSSGSKGKRYAMKSSEIMIHGIQITFPLAGEDIKASEDYFQYIDNLNTTVMKILSNNTGQSLDKVTNDCKKDVYMNAEESKKFGLIDHIL